MPGKLDVGGGFECPPAPLLAYALAHLPRLPNKLCYMNLRNFYSRASWDSMTSACILLAVSFVMEHVCRAKYFDFALSIIYRVFHRTQARKFLQKLSITQKKYEPCINHCQGINSSSNNWVFNQVSIIKILISENKGIVPIRSCWPLSKTTTPTHFEMLQGACCIFQRPKRRSIWAPFWGFTSLSAQFLHQQTCPLQPKQ